MERVFVTFPSLDDTELVPTILDAMAKAKHPERVFMGIALVYSRRRLFREFKEAIKPYKDRVRFSAEKLTYRNLIENTGVGRGRKKAADLYSDEEYVLQIDSHTLFAQDWDEKLIALHKDASNKLNHNKVLLTGYAGHYHYEAEGKRVPGELEGRLRYAFMVYHHRFSNAIPNWTDFPLPEDYDRDFVPAIKFNANFAFGNAEFGKYSGVFEDAVFFEEELLQTINLVDKGFTLVFPNYPEMLICHLYGGHTNDYGGYRSGVLDYLPGFLKDATSAAVNMNFYRFIVDPKNLKAIELWQDYAKCSLRFGTYKEYLIPEWFINVPNSSLKS